jgi:cytochrome c biogenesis protein CcdA
MFFQENHWIVFTTSAAGIAFILLGLLAVALPTSSEGILLWQLNPRRAIYLMDAAGSFALGLGLALTWVSGKLWNRLLLS